MKGIPESNIQGYPKYISFNQINEIKEQMEKCICKVLLGKEQSTGLFTKIKIPKQNKTVPVLVMCNHAHDKNLTGNETFSLDIKSEKEIKKINLKGRKYYTNENEYDITIIELKEEDNINNFLELDDEFNNTKYEGETLYILHYPNGELSVSFGTLKAIYVKDNEKQNFQHLCCTEKGSSGGAVMKKDNKLIGIHKEGNNGFNSGTFLNYPIKEFIKKNYTNNINNNINNKEIKKDEIDTSITELDKSDENLGNEGLNNLSNMKYNNLKQLILASNNIDNIQPLIKFKLDKLENLNLNNNQISDINTLEKIYFSKLTYLNLMNNNISNIASLEKINSNELKELFLNNNKIKEIKVLERVKFPNLEILDLNSNQISDINVLSKVNFNSLKNLNLSKNKISNIKVLQKIIFPNLKKLSLKENEITSINILNKVKLPQLEKIYLDNNKISDITVLKEIKLDKLNLICLTNNDIDKQKNSSLINAMKDKIMI